MGFTQTVYVSNRSFVVAFVVIVIDVSDVQCLIWHWGCSRAGLMCTNIAPVTTKCVDFETLV